MVAIVLVKTYTVTENSVLLLTIFVVLAGVDHLFSSVYILSKLTSYDHCDTSGFFLLLFFVLFFCALFRF